MTELNLVIESIFINYLLLIIKWYLMLFMYKLQTIYMLFYKNKKLISLELYAYTVLYTIKIMINNSFLAKERYLVK